MLPLNLAWKFIREGRTQSVLIIVGVGVGIGAFVFVSAIITGLQADMIERTLGTQAHLVIESEEPPPRPLMTDEDALFARRIEPAQPRRRPFDQWQRAVRRMESVDGVVAVCPKVAGSVLVQRGATQKGALLIGADPTRLRRIVDLASDIQSGEYRLGSDDALIGDILAADLGVSVGDPIRVVSDRREQTLRIAGIYHAGAQAVDGGWVVTSLRRAQTLLDRIGDVTAIDARVEDPFEADVIAARAREATNLEIDSWMGRNQELLTALRSQNQTTMMIRVFVLIAVAMGIASVLFVNIMQRRGQIGILRAVGTRRRTVLAIFLWQGTLLGAIGSMLGVMIGVLSAKSLEGVAFFEIRIAPSLVATAFVISILVGVVAAFFPARRAASMDPVDAIRGDG